MRQGDIYSTISSGNIRIDFGAEPCELLAGVLMSVLEEACKLAPEIFIYIDVFGSQIRVFITPGQSFMQSAVFDFFGSTLTISTHPDWRNHHFDMIDSSNVAAAAQLVAHIMRNPR